MELLTERQEEYLEYIKEFINDQGFSPSFSEMSRHFGVNPNASHSVVNVLEKKGYITRVANLSRTVRVVERSRKRQKKQTHPQRP